jgi:hypothetical protein
VTFSTLLLYSGLGVGGSQRFYNAIQQKKKDPNPMFWCMGFRLFILYCKTSFQDTNKWNY